MARETALRCITPLLDALSSCETAALSAAVAAFLSLPAMAARTRFTCERTALVMARLRVVRVMR